jgi:hypothetical protein
MRIRVMTGLGASPLSGCYQNSAAPVIEITFVTWGCGR